MEKNKFSRVLLVAMLAFVLALAACGGGDSGDGDKKKESGGKSEDGLYSIEDFNTETANKEDGEGGTLNYGLVSDTPFEGTLNFNFYSGAPDAEVIGFFDESLLSVDENYAYTQDGAATFEHTDDHKVWTFTIRDNVNWHDGKPVTAEDWAYAYEVIGHKDYDGVRYGSDFTIIEGMEDYHEGKADEISGIKVIDEKTLEITYDKPTPSLLAGGIWPYALPKHIFSKIEVADMSSSDAVRKNPIGMGPFKVEKITPGEAVTYVKNEDYWQGEPKIDEVVLKVIDDSVIINELQNGTVDLVGTGSNGTFPVDQFPDNADMSNVEFLGKVDNAYTYIGFKLGTWDKEAGKVKYSPEDSKVGDPELRRAMWYAVDNDAVGEKFYHGLRWNASGLIAPSHPDYHSEDIEAPTFDPDKANEILDEAGYLDTDDDGFRETPDGEELVLNFASMSGGDTAEPLANYYIQSWEKVGIKVELLDGRLQEFNTFYDRVGSEGNDDPEVDVYMGAWSVGSDVDPAGLYGQDAMFNFSRYASDKNDELLEKGVSEEAFDPAKRQEIYKEWQEFMIDEVPVFPTLYRAVLVPVNKRVGNLDIKTGTKVGIHDWTLTEDKALVHDGPIEEPKKEDEEDASEEDEDEEE